MNDNHKPIPYQIRLWLASRSNRKLSNQTKAFLQEKFK